MLCYFILRLNKKDKVVSSNKMKNHQIQNWLKIAKPFIAVVFLQLGYAGMDVLAKAALNKEMSNYVLVVYRHAVAFLVITPFALVLDKKVRPKMTISIFMKIVALSLLEPVLEQNMFVLGIKYTTATFSAAMENMIPAITFLMAWILRCKLTFAFLERLEKVKVKSIRSQAKVFGTLATVSGAMVMTLVKGPILGLFGTHGSNYHNQHNVGANIQHPVKGAVMLIIGCFSFAIFVILQAITLETYPAELSLTSWICLLGTFEGAILAVIMERDNPSVWSLKWDIRLLTAVYSGIVCSGLAYYLQGVVMKTRGPVFVTAFSPLSMVIVAIMSSLFLAEKLYLGRIIGAVVIVLGLYLVVWGKSKDYNTQSPIINDPIVSAEQITDERNAEKGHSTQEIISIGNSGVAIAARDEKV